MKEEVELSYRRPRSMRTGSMRIGVDNAGCGMNVNYVWMDTLEGDSSDSQ